MLVGPRPIRFVVWSMVASGPLVAGCGFVPWEYNFELGLQKAARRQQPALVQFYSGLNRDCLEMDRKVFTDPDVRENLKDYVPVRLDYHLNRELADQLGVEALPAFFVFRRDTSIAGSYVGKMDAGKFNFFLIKYRYY